MKLLERSSSETYRSDGPRLNDGSHPLSQFALRYRYTRIQVYTQTQHGSVGSSIAAGNSGESLGGVVCGVGESGDTRRSISIARKKEKKGEGDNVISRVINAGRISICRCMRSRCVLVRWSKGKSVYFRRINKREWLCTYT